MFALSCPFSDPSSGRQAAKPHTTPERPSRRRISRSKAAEARPLPPAQHMDNCFITALVQAGSCHDHAVSSRRATPFASPGFGLTRTRRKAETCGTQRRQLHTKSSRPEDDSNSVQGISKKDLHSLVDIYGTWKEKDVVETEDLDDGVAVGPEVLDRPWDESYFTDNKYIADSPPWSEAVEVLQNIKLLLQDPEASHEKLYSLYQKLPGNRVNYLPPSVLSKFIAHLSRVSASRFQKENANKFLSVLYDMREQNMTVNLALWTTAIRFLGLSEGPRQAVRLWREMEQHYGIKGNNYTFSVLFDLAAKGQHFALAEMIEKEARDRHINLDRISRMSRIFYYGMLGNGQGVRQAYAQFVDAGEIVDTAVLTNVITGLIDAGELPAAEETFERMKLLHTEKKGATHAPQNWRQRRELRILLTDAAHRYRGRLEDRQRFQDAAPINPDWRTYRAFIRHHAIDTGDWDKLEELLDEMKKAGIHLNREIYRCLFSGFAKHGGIQLASWNRKNLETVWSEFEKSCKRDPLETSLTPALAVTIIKAFFYCTDKWRAREVWESMLERWTLPNELHVTMERLLRQHKAWWQRS